jgi:hypothetical protein
MSQQLRIRNVKWRYELKLNTVRRDILLSLMEKPQVCTCYYKCGFLTPDPYHSTVQGYYRSNEICWQNLPEFWRNLHTKDRVYSIWTSKIKNGLIKSARVFFAENNIRADIHSVGIQHFIVNTYNPVMKRIHHVSNFRIPLIPHRENAYIWCTACKNSDTQSICYGCLQIQSSDIRKTEHSFNQLFEEHLYFELSKVSGKSFIQRPDPTPTFKIDPPHSVRFNNWCEKLNDVSERVRAHGEKLSEFGIELEKGAERLDIAINNLEKSMDISKKCYEKDVVMLDKLRDISTM